MKKFIYISLLIIGAGFTSCEEPIIMPNDGLQTEQPEWQDGTSDFTRASSDKSLVMDGSGDEEVIVDPNDDDDLGSRGKVH